MVSYMTNKDKVLDFLSNHTQPFCDDCISNEMGIKPRQQINSICRTLFNENKIFRLKSCCVQCNKEKVVNCYFLVSINNYNEAFIKLCDILPRIDFNDTLQIIKKIDYKLNNHEDPTGLIGTAPLILKTDFLANTNTGLIAYNIITKLWTDYSEKYYKKSKKPPTIPPISFKYSLIDGNLGVIKELIEESKKTDKENIKIRFYILLLGVILLEQIVMEYADMLFHNLLQGKFDNKGGLRNYLISNYFKIDNIVIAKRKYKPDLTKLRNILAHGWFMTKDEKIYLYPQGKKNIPPEIYNFQDIVKIYDITMVKLTFMDIYRVIMFYLALAQQRAEEL
jgi:hypothetical protein